MPNTLILPTLVGSKMGPLDDKSNQEWLEENFSGIINLWQGTYRGMGFRQFGALRHRRYGEPELETVEAFNPGKINTSNPDIMLAVLENHQVTQKPELLRSFTSALTRQQNALDSRMGISFDNTPNSSHLTYCKNGDNHSAQTLTVENCNLAIPLEIKTRKQFETTKEVDKEDVESSYTIYSEFPEHVINSFGGAIDLTGLSLDLTINLKEEVNKRENEYARRPKFQEYKEPKVNIDSISSFSCFGQMLPAPLFLEAIGNNSHIKVLHLEHLYRGGADGVVKPKMTNTRPVKITKGSFLFPYLTKRKILCQDTLEIKEEIFFCLGMFDSLEKIIKYKRSRSFIPELITGLCEDEGIKIFNPEEYAEIMKKKYGSYTQYWNGVPELFKKKLPKEAIAIDVIKMRGDTCGKVKEKHMSYLLRGDNLSLQEEAVAFDKISTTYNKMKQVVRSKLDEKALNEGRARECKRRIDELEHKLNREKTHIESWNTNAKRAESDYETYIASSQNLEVKYNKAKLSYKHFIEDFDIETKDNNYNSKFLENLKKTGIIVDDIIYSIKQNIDDEEDLIEVSITEDPKIAYTAKFDNHQKDIILSRIQFHTNKPVIIRVDAGAKGDKCKKVVGGPYIVEITKDKIRIGLANSSSCFGILDDNRNKTLWVHPHAPSQYIRQSRDNVDNVSWRSFQSFIQSSHNGCLGEASPLLYKAFEQNDVKLAIFSAMTWITSANSADPWGKSWKYFPPLSQVRINENNAEDTNEKTEEQVLENMITSEEGMESIAETVANNLAEILDTDLFEDRIDPITGEEQAEAPDPETINTLIPAHGRNEPPAEPMPHIGPVLENTLVRLASGEFAVDPNQIREREEQLQVPGNPNYTPYHQI